MGKEIEFTPEDLQFLERLDPNDPKHSCEAPYLHYLDQLRSITSKVKAHVEVFQNIQGEAPEEIHQ